MGGEGDPAPARDPVASRAPDSPVDSAPPPFRAGKALLSFLLVLLAQAIAVLMLVSVGEVISPGKSSLKEPGFQTALLLSVSLAFLAGAFLAARLWARALVRDRSPSGLGLFIPARGQILRWTSSGVGLAILWVAFSMLSRSHASQSLGPVAQAAARGGLARLVWALIAIGIAPLGEELLFRGLLYKGFEASWGRTAASVLVTALFVSLHVAEVSHQWVALAPITLLALLALAARRKTGSLAPAMALHSAYNGSIVAFVYILSP
jgi:membrane protease YdiL (CAAX protease family)